MVGGWSQQPVNMDDAGTQKAIQTAMANLTSQNGELSQGDWRVQKVNSVSTQVVSGLNYKLNVELVNNQGHTKEMQWVVYEQSWTSTYELTSSTDIPSSSNSKLTTQQKGKHRQLQMIGGFKAQDTTLTPELESLINFGMQSIQEQTQNALTFENSKIVKVLSYYTQVVAGLNHKLSVQVSYGNSTKILMIVIWSQAWLSQSKQNALSEFYVLDNTLSFEVQSEETSTILQQAAIKVQTSLNPKVTYNIGNVISSYSATAYGKTLAYFNCMMQGTDNSIAHYEYWFGVQNGQMTSVNNLNFFLSQQLSFQGMSSVNVGAVQQGETVNCGDINSYFLCEVYPQCNASAFLTNGTCTNN